MPSAHATYLRNTDIRQISLPILNKQLNSFGFHDVDVREEEDFDGSYVVRMTAHVKSRVPARELIDVVNDIQDILRKKGDLRFVFLSTKLPGSDEPDEDAE